MQRSASNKRTAEHAKHTQGRPKKKVAKHSSGEAVSEAWQLDGDFAFKDALLAPAPRRITRTQLDAQIAARCAAKNAPASLSKISTGSKPGSLTGLQRACLRVIAANCTNQTVLKQLANVVLPPNLLDHLAVRLAGSVGNEMPFATWSALVQAGLLLGSTYRGLVLDDTVELRELQTAVPPIAIFLDLSDTAFQRDFHIIRTSVGSTLTAFRLDGLTHVDDGCVSDLARTAGETQLQILCLKGCPKVTDRSASKLAQFASLRMLDLRKTSCTSFTKDILRKAFRPPYISAANSKHTALFGPIDLASTWRMLQAVLARPFAPGAADESEDEQAAVIVTHLTRLDETKVKDPRDLVRKNPFHVSTSAFGSVWTTRPIDAKSLDEEKHHSRFEAGNSSRSQSTAEIQMSRFDLGWRRKRRKAKGKEKAQTVEKVLEDDSDIESVPASALQNAEPGEGTKPQTSFYEPERKETSEPAMVAADSMMLLRLVPKQIAAAKKATPVKKACGVFDSQPLRVVKRKATAGPTSLSYLTL